MRITNQNIEIDPALPHSLETNYTYGNVVTLKFKNGMIEHYHNCNLIEYKFESKIWKTPMIAIESLYHMDSIILHVSTLSEIIINKDITFHKKFIK